MGWLGFALPLLAWPSALTALNTLARSQPSFRLLGLLVAFALPGVGALTLIRGLDLTAPEGRRLRAWAHLATVAPVIATALRVPQGLPQREIWLALFGASLAVSLLRSLRERGTVAPTAAPSPSPPTAVLRLHRWSAVVIVAFAALHFAGHLSAAFSLALNTRVVDWTRQVYKRPVLEGLLLFSLPVQIVGGLWLFASAKDRTQDRWDRLQLVSGFYLAVFIAAHTTATAVLFRDLNFRAASGGEAGLFGDPSFLAYYVLGPLAVFSHVACAARSLLARRLGAARAERWARALLGLGAAATLVIALALTGVYTRNDRDQPQPRPAKVGSTSKEPPSQADRFR
jgi:hypothetical protein